MWLHSTVRGVADLDREDLLRRATAAARRSGAGTEVVGLRPLEGGVSSLTFASSLHATDGEHLVVLKVAPPGLAPVHNRDVLRHARVMEALRGVDGFPVPGIRLSDDGAPPFFAMDLLPGDSYEPNLDVSDAPPTAEVAAARFDAAAHALARLHGVAPASIGLGRERVLTPRDELERWSRLFATVDADLHNGQAALLERLLERVPEPVAPVIHHGDYRCANMLFVGPDLQAVIDWEIWSIGDPRHDLAWLLTQTDPPHVFHETRPDADLASAALLPSAAGLLTIYLDALGGDHGEELTRDLRWFIGLCEYKTASTLAAIVKRDRRQAVPSPRLTVVARHLAEVVEAGHAALDGTRFVLD